MTGTPSLPADVRALFTGRNYAHVATLLPDGAPHAVPVWADVEGDLVAFYTEPGSRKARNLERDPRVALSVVDQEQPLAMATVRGRVVRRLEGEEGWTVIDRIARKYNGAPYPRDEELVALLVEVEHAWSHDFS